MFKILAFSAAVTLLFVSQLAVAGSRLIDRRDRPTMAQVEAHMRQRKFDESDLQSLANMTSQMNIIATTIAEIEWAYPGAIYMPLGRDVAFAGDVIDAFYLSQGQKGRVIRLNASGQSLWGQSEKMIARFVKSSGVDLNDGRTYIFFDGSSYGPSSQSSTILRSFYHEYVRQGGKAKDLLTKFNFFNTYRNWTSVGADASVDRDAFLRAQIEHLEKNPDGIPTTTFASTAQPYGGLEWHTNFEALTELPDGSVIAPTPDKPYPLANREAVLSQLRAVRIAVTKPAFTDIVKARAKELGYEFKFKRSCGDLLSAR